MVKEIPGQEGELEKSLQKQSGVDKPDQSEELFRTDVSDLTQEPKIAEIEKKYGWGDLQEDISDMWYGFRKIEDPNNAYENAEHNMKQILKNNLVGESDAEAFLTSKISENSSQTYGDLLKGLMDGTKTELTDSDYKNLQTYLNGYGEYWAEHNHGTDIQGQVVINPDAYTNPDEAGYTVIKPALDLIDQYNNYWPRTGNFKDVIGGYNQYLTREATK